MKRGRKSVEIRSYNFRAKHSILPSQIKKNSEKRQNYLIKRKLQLDWFGELMAF